MDYLRIPKRKHLCILSAFFAVLLYKIHTYAPFLTKIPRSEQILKFYRKIPILGFSGQING